MRVFPTCVGMNRHVAVVVKVDKGVPYDVGIIKNSTKGEYHGVWWLW